MCSYSDFMKNIFTLAVIAICLQSCSSKHPFQIVFSNVEGLYTSSKVMSQGVELGKVVDMNRLPDNRILVKVELEQLKDIPSDSKFIIEKGLFDSSLELKIGSASSNFKATDTIVGENKSSVGVETVDNVGRSVESIFTAADKQDSILERLNRIEHKLDELNKKLK